MVQCVLFGATLLAANCLLGLIGAFFIIKDQLMYSEFRKKNVDVKSVSLNEELGQI